MSLSRQWWIKLDDLHPSVLVVATRLAEGQDGTLAGVVWNRGVDYVALLISRVVHDPFDGSEEVKPHALDGDRASGLLAALRMAAGGHSQESRSPCGAI